MLEDMYAVINRINQIQKRFNSGFRNSVNNVAEKKETNFDNTLKEVIDKKSVDTEKVKSNSANIPVSKIKEIAKEYAIKNGLPPTLVNAVIKVESAFNPMAISKKGASGLMQLMPSIIKDLGVTNPFNAEDNIKGGVTLLKKLLNKYDWDFKKALAAYNAGETAVDKNNGIPPYKETRQYVKKVIDAYSRNIK